MTTFDLENPEPLVGDTLRDEAANLLSAKYGRPTRETRVMGKKTDLYFKWAFLGKETRVYVEAKDEGSRLGRTDVVNIWADYSGIIDNNKPAVLLLVTRLGLTSDAQAYVQDEQSNMRHQTIWELENEILGLTDYIRDLANIFKQDGLDTYYIPGRAKVAEYNADEVRAVKDGDVDIFAYIQTWLSSDETKPVAILGGYGAGKTSFAKRLISFQAQTALLDPLARRPVFIRLGSFSRYSSLEGLLGGMFTHEYPVDGFNVRRFLDLNEKGRLFIVLDGFDEMKHAMTWADFRSQISELNKLINGKSKILLLGRPSAFTSNEEHVHVLRGMKRIGDGWWKLPDWPSFTEYDLQEFSTDERALFVREYLKYRTSKTSTESSSLEWIESRVDEVNCLADMEKEVFSKPVHAKILTDLAANPSVDLKVFANGVSRWQLYEAFFASIVEREMDKEARRPIIESERLNFIREIAFWLWSSKGGVTAFSAHELPDSIIAQLATGDASELEGLKREYLQGSFLEKKSGDIYYFGHRSFAEFLVAERMVKKQPGPAEQSVYSRLCRDGVLLFLKEAPSQEPIKAWSDTLSSAQGEIHVEYLSFLSDVHGGLPNLISALPTNSIWQQVLSIFGKEVSFNNTLHTQIFRAMRSPDNTLFFLLLSLLQYQGALAQAKAKTYAISIAAVLLDRVFETASVDTSNGKASVDLAFEEAKNIAAAAVPEIDDSFGERHLVFRGQRLLQAKSEKLRQVGIDLCLQPPAAMLNLADELKLPWSDVLKEMSKSNSAKAIEYFRRAKSLRSIYTVAYAKNKKGRK